MPSEETILLWCDVESTGLPIDARPMTVLEAAWTVTDGTGRQLTPLRQAFTKLVVMMPHHKITTRDGMDPITPRSRNGVPTKPYWSSGSYPAPLVREMHDRSGLSTEWLTIEQERPWRIVSQGAHLDGLLLDDLGRVMGPNERPKVYLAGAGVSHMEATFLPRLCPRTAELLHYASIDVSTELRARRLRSGDSAPGNVDEQIAAAAEIAASGDATWARTIEEALDCFADVEVDHGGRFDAEPLSTTLYTSDLAGSHRAAVDIARALAAYRSLSLLDEHALDRAEERGAAVARPI